LRQLGRVNFTKLFYNINRLVKDLTITSKRSNNILLSNEEHIDLLLNNLKFISHNMVRLSEHAKNFPSAVLLGKNHKKLDLNKI